MVRVNRWICEHLSDSSMWQKGIILCGIFAENGKSPIESGYTICLLCLLIYFREFSFLFFMVFFSSCLFHITKIQRNTIRFAYDDVEKEQAKSTNENNKIKEWNGKFTLNRLSKVCLFPSAVESSTFEMKIQVTWNLNTAHTVSKLYEKKIWGKMSALSALKHKIFQQN